MLLSREALTDDAHIRDPFPFRGKKGGYLKLCLEKHC